MVGLETRYPCDRYEWHGLHRGGEANHPYFIFQYTLAGRGCFEDATSHALQPGSAFLARIPSDHRYFLPVGSDVWTFFFLLIRHGETVRRLERIVTTFGPVHGFPPGSVPIVSGAALVRDFEAGWLADEIAEEQGLFHWALECERFLRNRQYPSSERDTVLLRIQDFVATDAARPWSVSDVADSFGMSRSHFSHWFARTCGGSPGRYLLELRLRRVAEFLRQEAPQPGLKEIAAATGFSDANLLCKAFRRHYGMSPGTFRRTATGR